MEDWITFDGKYYRVKDSNLYTKPLQPISIFVAGIGPQSARLAGREADGFVTNEANPELIESKLLPAFRDGAMKAGRNPEALDKVLFLPASYDPDKQKALESIAYWRGAMVKAFFEVNFPDPRKIEESAQAVGMDTMEKMDKYVRLGFTEIVLINSSPNRETFIKLLSQEIAPAMKAL
jgi:coenzyme F420-dependent glucose-6-phosphate dehydrogenase